MSKLCSGPGMRSTSEVRRNRVKGLSQRGRRRIFLKKRASLFNDDLSNEPNFGRVHLAGQYL